MGEAFGKADVEAMVLDTNILIGYLNGDQTVIDRLSQWRREGRSLFVSAITWSEVLSAPVLAPEDLNLVKEFLASFLCIPVDQTLAETAAFIKRVYRIPIPDATIAATAIKFNLPLVSRDRDFRHIKEILLLEI